MIPEGNKAILTKGNNFASIQMITKRGKVKRGKPSSYKERSKGISSEYRDLQSTVIQSNS